MSMAKVLKGQQKHTGFLKIRLATNLLQIRMTSIHSVGKSKLHTTERLHFHFASQPTWSLWRPCERKMNHFWVEGWQRQRVLWFLHHHSHHHSGFGSNITHSASPSLLAQSFCPRDPVLFSFFLSHYLFYLSIFLFLYYTIWVSPVVQWERNRLQ